MKLFRVRVGVQSDVWALDKKNAVDRVRDLVFQAITEPAVLAQIMNPRVTTAGDVAEWKEPA